MPRTPSPLLDSPSTISLRAGGPPNLYELLEQGGTLGYHGRDYEIRPGRDGAPFSVEAGTGSLGYVVDRIFAKLCNDGVDRQLETVRGWLAQVEQQRNAVLQQQRTSRLARGDRLSRDDVVALISGLKEQPSSSAARAPRLDLRGRDLSMARLAGLNLRNADLGGAGLAGADLSGTCLAGANLANASLVGAVLDKADLDGAELGGADFTKARLTGASVRDAMLALGKFRNVEWPGADLRGMTLAGADFSGAMLSGADLRNAVLTETDFTGAILDQAKLQGAVLKGVAFARASLRLVDLSHRADLAGISFGGAMLEYACFDGSDLSFTTLNEASLVRATLRGTRLDEASLFGANCSLADLSGASGLAGSDMGAINLKEATLRGTDLRMARLFGAKLGGADLTDTDLSGAFLGCADFTGASLTRTRMEGACLEGATLTSARLADTTMSHANLAAANLQEAVLDGVDLSDAILTGARMRRVTMTSSNLLRAELANASLHGARLEAVDLSGANLQGAALDKACLSHVCLRTERAQGARLAGASLSDIDIGTGEVLPQLDWDGVAMVRLTRLQPGPKVSAPGSHDRADWINRAAVEQIDRIPANGVRVMLMQQAADDLRAFPAGQIVLEPAALACLYGALIGGAPYLDHSPLEAFVSDGLMPYLRSAGQRVSPASRTFPLFLYPLLLFVSRYATRSRSFAEQHRVAILQISAMALCQAETAGRLGEAERDFARSTVERSLLAANATVLAHDSVARITSPALLQFLLQSVSADPAFAGRYNGAMVQHIKLSRSSGAAPDERGLGQALEAAYDSGLPSSLQQALAQWRETLAEPVSALFSQNQGSVLLLTDSYFANRVLGEPPVAPREADHSWAEVVLYRRAAADADYEPVRQLDPSRDFPDFPLLWEPYRSAQASTPLGAWLYLLPVGRFRTAFRCALEHGMPASERIVDAEAQWELQTCLAPLMERVNDANTITEPHLADLLRCFVGLHRDARSQAFVLYCVSAVAVRLTCQRFLGTDIDSPTALRRYADALLGRADALAPGLVPAHVLQEYRRRLVGDDLADCTDQLSGDILQSLERISAASAEMRAIWRAAWPRAWGIR